MTRTRFRKGARLRARQPPGSADALANEDPLAHERDDTNGSTWKASGHLTTGSAEGLPMAVSADVGDILTLEREDPLPSRT